MVDFIQELASPHFDQVTNSIPGPQGAQGIPGTGDTSVNNIQASQAIAAQDFVNVYDAGGSTLRVRKADATDPDKFANGFAPAAIANGAMGLVTFNGLNAASVNAAAVVYLSDTTPGSFQTSPPTAAGHIVQPLGPALPGQGIPFTLQPAVTL